MRREFDVLIKSLKHPRRLKNLLALTIRRRRPSTYLNYSPITIDLEPTVRCNLACEMCQVASWDRRVPDLTLDDFKLFVERIPTVMKIKLQGMGEPLLNRTLFDMVNYASTKGIRVETNTNGTLLNERICHEILDSGLGSISISLDGATAQTFERIRARAKFTRVVKNIERLLALRGKSRVPEVRIWMLGMRENIHELPDVIRLCRELGVDHLTLQHDLVFWGKEDWLRRLSSRALRDDPETERAVHEATLLARRIGLPFRCYRGNRLSVAKGIRCPWPWYSVLVTADGYVCPCCVAADPRVIHFGDLRSQRFEDIWNSTQYQLFRRELRAGNIPTFCRGCYEDYNKLIQL